jgi:hypothetical protein
MHTLFYFSSLQICRSLPQFNYPDFQIMNCSDFHITDTYTRNSTAQMQIEGPKTKITSFPYTRPKKCEQIQPRHAPTPHKPNDPPRDPRTRELPAHVLPRTPRQIYRNRTRNDTASKHGGNEQAKGEEMGEARTPGRRRGGTRRRRAPSRRRRRTPSRQRRRRGYYRAGAGGAGAAAMGTWPVELSLSDSGIETAGGLSEARPTLYL